MAWTASVLTSAFRGGAAEVTVRYAEGSETIDETYRATTPTADWIPRTVRDRIAQLTAVSTFAIPTGPVAPADADTPPDAAPAVFKNRMRLLTEIHALIGLGIVPDTNAKFLAYKAWLQSNLVARWDTYVGS